MERPYQHVARHRYDASGSLPTPLSSLLLLSFLFFFPPALPAAELETSPSISRLMNAAARPVSPSSAPRASPVLTALRIRCIDE